ncbi:MAG: hypothetical protein LUO80_05795 [Methylococcaceae bacterium]|nr:hypothetical protein [Methylococcaceae bacterium]
MLIVANIISNLVERLRTQADISTQRERRAIALYRLSEALAEAGNEGDIARVSEKRIEAEFGIHSALLFPNPQGQGHLSVLRQHLYTTHWAALILISRSGCLRRS